MTSDLKPGFAQPVGHWLMVLFNGDARARPRAASTVHVYFSSARRPLVHWAARYDHLREVTRRDIGAALEPLLGYQRVNTTSALRSLFGFAKKRALIFANPTIGLKARPGDCVLLPLTEEQIHALEALATDPACRVIIALAADNAAHRRHPTPQTQRHRPGQSPHHLGRVPPALRRARSPRPTLLA